jgi:hypothetical protein
MAVPEPLEQPGRGHTTLGSTSGSRPAPPEPSLPELDAMGRLVLGASVATDIAVRTALSSLIVAAATPWALRPSARGERRRLRFYSELADAEDVTASFPAPPRGIAVTSSRAAPWSFRAPGGNVSTLQFESPFVAINPAVRPEYASHRRNRVAWAQHWRHADGPRPTLCVIHGFGASPYVINSAFFALPWLYGKGYDVLLYLMPFHGPRRDRLVGFNGADLFAHGPSIFNEAIAHAVHDFRVFIDYLEESGARAGVTGLSLGGYMSALLAVVEPRLQVAIPNAPVADIERLIPGWFPANIGVGIASLLHAIPIREAAAALAMHSPLTYKPLLPQERLMIIGGLGDRLTPPAQTKLLWEHWGRPRLHWYPGNHILHVNRAQYLREMRRFMEGAGFPPD